MFKVITGGFIQRDEGLEILNKLKQTFQTIDTTKHYFILDASEFKAAFQTDLDVLKEVLELYDQTPFIKKFIILPANFIAQIQTHKIDNTNLLKNSVVVKSFTEALSMIKSKG